MAAETSRFAAVTAIDARGEGRYAVDIDAGWTVGGVPNGGYLLALLGRAAVDAVHHPHPLAASVHYLRPPRPGPAEVRTDVLRSGRSISQVRVRLGQEETACVEATFTIGTVHAGADVRWTRLSVPELTRFEDCARLPSTSPNGIAVTVLNEVDVRLDPAVLGFARGAPSGQGELRGWLAQLGGEPFDVFSLLYAVDAFPPASFDIADSGWVPTLELTAYVRALPAPGPVRVVQRAQLIADDRLDEVCFVWDSTARLVAQATQLAGVRLR